MDLRREFLPNNCPEMPGMTLNRCIFNRHVERISRIIEGQKDASTTGSQKKSQEKRIDLIEQKTIGKTSTICIDNCSYSVIGRIANMFNMKEVEEQDDWNVYWTDNFISYERAKHMKNYQKVNHFPGMSAICHKYQLGRNLNRMLRLFPEEYNYFPKTWCLPADFEEVLTFSRNHRNKTYILKPDKGSRGKGIFLTKRIKNFKPFEKMVCQVYISKPFVMDGLKFDFRIYVLITSCDPLRIYVYNEGLARFATSLYCEPAADNSANVYMHLTNYSVNKDSEMFLLDGTAGSKRRLSAVDAWLNHNNYNVPKMWAAIDDIIVKTLIAAYPTLKHSYHTCFLGHKSTYACFELLGFDILLDYKLKPYLLEVNHSPSFHIDSYLDRDVKESLLKDTFNLLNLSKCDKKRVKEEDKQRVQNRMMKVIHKKGSPLINESTQSPSDTHNLQMMWEENHLGNYRQVYPSTDADKYSPYFNQTQSSLLQKTVASRARAQGEEFEKKKPPSNSFGPIPIVEAVEKKRLPGLAQKESLLSSCRVLDQVSVLLLNTALVTKIEEKQTTSMTSIIDIVDGKLSKLKKKIISEEKTINHSLKGPMQKPHFPFLLPNEATLRIRPEDLPVSTEWPTTNGMGVKNRNTRVPHHLLNSVTVHCIERQLSDDKNTSCQ